MAEGWRNLSTGQHLRGEPVPDPQEVVRSPAHDERQDDDQRHLESPHPSPRDVVVGAPEVDFSGGDWKKE